ncbi:hypothetical protein SCARR_03021 [Pontiella sulfatireligans]|uniref:Uncharacterized protein n=1 Tax=Pontiella sulfatireligans TaxID=2750658 RepID=A0A6C2UNR1_9BACT|nr:hypothetical protein SCARR_03021 [Pontiella sulfatireligans]
MLRSSRSTKAPTQFSAISWATPSSRNTPRSSGGSHAVRPGGQRPPLQPNPVVFGGVFVLRGAGRRINLHNTLPCRIWLPTMCLIVGFCWFGVAGWLAGVPLRARGCNRTNGKYGAPGGLLCRSAQTLHCGFFCCLGMQFPLVGKLTTGENRYAAN